MQFLYPYVLFLLLLIPVLWIFLGKSKDALKNYFTPELYEKMVAKGGGMSRRSRQALLLASLALGIVALARPVIDNGEIKVKSETTDLVVAFDISRSMFADDVYPNRFSLSQRKFFDLLESLKDTRIAVIGFSSRAFLVAPLTSDYASLRYLVKNMGLDYISLKGTDMMAPLEVTKNLLKNRTKKALLIFTDGGDKKDFSKEIDFAKREGIKVFIYAVGTDKGGVMKVGRDVVRDENGDVVITHLNRAVKSLAESSGGVYKEFSFKSGDMMELATIIKKSLSSSKVKEDVIRDRKELFKIPLMLAIVLFLMSFSSLPKWSRV
jgi:Ca-activated chloride channel family protein